MKKCCETQTSNRLESYIRNRVKKQAIEIASGTIKTFNFQSILIGARYVYLKYNPIVFDNIVQGYYYKHKKIYSTKLQSVNNSKYIKNITNDFYYINRYKLYQYLLCVDVIEDLALKEADIVKYTLYIALWYSDLEMEDNLLANKNNYKFDTIKETLHQQAINISLNIQYRFDITFIYKHKDIHNAKLEYTQERRRLVKKINRISNHKTILFLQNKYNSINVVGIAKFLILQNRINIKSSNSLSILEDIIKIILNIRLAQPYYNNKNIWIDNLYHHKNDSNYDTKDILEICNICKESYDAQ